MSKHCRKNMFTYLRDFRPLTQRRPALCSSGLLHGEQWLSLTDILGQPISPIFRGQAFFLEVLTFITYHSWWRWTHHVRVRMHPWRRHRSPVGIERWRSTKSGTARPSKVRRWWTSEWRTPRTITPSTESWWSMSRRRTPRWSEVVRCPASSISYTEKGEKKNFTY